MTKGVTPGTTEERYVPPGASKRVLPARAAPGISHLRDARDCPVSGKVSGSERALTCANDWWGSRRLGRSVASLTALRRW